MSEEHKPTVRQWLYTLKPHATWIECSCGVTTDSFHHDDPQEAKRLAWKAWEKHNADIEERGRQIEYERHRAGNCRYGPWHEVDDNVCVYNNAVENDDSCPADWQSCPLNKAQERGA